MKTWILAAIALVVIVGAIGASMLLTSRPTGKLVIGVTDSPINSDVTHIYLTISDIKLQGDGNSTVSYKINATTFDLIQLDNVTKMLGNNSIPVGNYTMIRFTVVSAKATISGVNVSLTVPSGEIKVPLTDQQLQVKSGMTTTVVIDITANSTNISASKNLSPVVHVKSISGPSS